MQRRLLHILASVLIIGGSLSFVWWLQTESSRSAPDITIQEAISRIDRGDFKEVRFDGSSAEFTDRDGIIFATTLGSDATRELLVTRTYDFIRSDKGMTSGMKITEAPASASFGWILMRFLPIPLLFTGIGLALGLFLSRIFRK